MNFSTCYLCKNNNTKVFFHSLYDGDYTHLKDIF